MRLFPSALLTAFGLLTMTVNPSQAQTLVETHTDIGNASPYPITVGVSLDNRPYVWAKLQPNEVTTFPGYTFLYDRYYFGQKNVRIAIRYNGATRTSSLPFYALQGRLVTQGVVFKRSPGVLGLQFIPPR